MRRRLALETAAVRENPVPEIEESAFVCRAVTDQRRTGVVAHRFVSGRIAIFGVFDRNGENPSANPD
jgi:hypothetical protein